MSLRFLPAPGPVSVEEPAQVAFAAHRANAVTRNRIRRRLRAVVAEHDRALLPGGRYLFSGTPEAATVPFPELVEAVGRLVRDAAAETRPERP